jgi:hypothetical protein
VLFVYPVKDSERYGVGEADERSRLVTKSAYGSYLV